MLHFNPTESSIEKFKVDLDGADVYSFYFLFEFEQESNKLIIYNLNEEELKYEVDPLVFSDVIDNIQQVENRFLKDVVLPNGEINLFSILNFTDVMLSYKLYKDMEFDLSSNDEEGGAIYLKGYSEFKEFLDK